MLKAWKQQSHSLRPCAKPRTVFAERAAKETQEFPLFPAYGDDVFAAVEKAATKKLEKLLTIPGKQERDDATNEYMEQVEEKLLDQFEDLEEADASKQIRGAYNALMKQIVRQKILRGLPYRWPRRYRYP